MGCAPPKHHFGYLRRLNQNGWLALSSSPKFYRTTEAQQAAQPMDGPARRLATHMLGEFFAAPLVPDRPRPKLVIDNDRSKTAP
jgi:hypothetical protein